MPISSTHPKYSDFTDQWERCRDVIDGSDAVKAKGNKYLPKLSGMTDTEYNAYKKRALFFSASGRSLQGLVGTMTRRTPTIVQEGMDAHFKDTSLSAKSFTELFVDACEEILSVGRFGMLADVGTDGGRAYVATYESESILNWRVDSWGNLTMLVLAETIDVPSEGDQFEIEEQTQYRHLCIENDVYIVRVYDEDESIISTVTPTQQGSVMNRIPFVCISPHGLQIIPEKPPMLDIVDVNLSQYMTSADLENGRHFAGLPTPIVTGAESESKLTVGGTTAWVISNDKAKVFYLEFQGQGLQSLEKAMAEKTSQMAQFSSRLMDTSTRGSEASETVRLRHSADSATLASVAMSAEAGFNTIFGYVADFDRLEHPQIELNKDFLDTKLSPPELTALTNSYVTGAIDLETYIYNLQRGELLPHGKDTMDTKPAKPGSNGGSDDQTKEELE